MNSRDRAASGDTAPTERVESASGNDLAIIGNQSAVLEWLVYR